MSSTDTVQTVLSERLRALNLRFRNGLPNRLAVIVQLVAAVDASRVDELIRHFHSLAGTAATYRLYEIAELAAEAQALCEEYAVGPALHAVIAELDHAISKVTDPFCACTGETPEGYALGEPIRELVH